jgi:site-specific DNA-methyltransferase (adenine-specific)|nr:MAG TPA: adenine-specific methyltransferase [Caudoviricetes sp.]
MNNNERYKLYQGDCLEIMDKLIKDGVKVDAVISDPPYGMEFKSNRRKEKYKQISNDDDLSFLDEYFQKCDKLLKDNTHIYCFCSWHHIDKFKIAFEKYFTLKNIIVWEKNNISMGDLKGSYAPKHEFILFGHKGRRLRNGKRLPDVIQAKRTGNKLHPTQKPVDLLEIFIKQSTNENDLILDSFMGSGSTGVACLNTNRRFIGIELNENYFNISKERLENVKLNNRQKKLF